jgi:ankyrin repeat protein
MLIEHGADVMAKDKKHELTPLHLASLTGQVEVVRMLIEPGTDVMAILKSSPRARLIPP